MLLQAYKRVCRLDVSPYDVDARHARISFSGFKFCIIEYTYVACRTRYPKPCRSIHRSTSTKRLTPIEPILRGISVSSSAIDIQTKVSRTRNRLRVHAPDKVLNNVARVKISRRRSSYRELPCSYYRVVDPVYLSGIIAF